jgi:isoleucyl-tRNA synthetase
LNRQENYYVRSFMITSVQNLQHYKLSVLDLDEVYFLAWTTTPWTLPSNTALTVGPKLSMF